MKKIAIIALSVILILSAFCSCNKKDNRESSSINNIVFVNTNGFVAAIQEAKQKQNSGTELTSDELILVGLESVPYPTADFSEYSLKQIKVSQYYIVYEYSLLNGENSTEADSGIVKDNKITFTFNREPLEEGVDAFEILAKQYKNLFQVEVSQDGVIYVEEYAEMAFRVGQSWGYVTVPTQLNSYETMLPLCVYDVIDIAK